METLKEGKFQ